MALNRNDRRGRDAKVDKAVEQLEGTVTGHNSEMDRLVGGLSGVARTTRVAEACAADGAGEDDRGPDLQGRADGLESSFGPPQGDDATTASVTGETIPLPNPSPQGGGAHTAGAGWWRTILEPRVLAEDPALGQRCGQLLGAINAEWWLSARREQRAPAGDWRTWLVIGGRGSGKTRAGAEWVLDSVRTAGRPLRIALVAETLADAREVMVDGMSGICRIARSDRPEVEISRRRLVWPNGTVAQMFSSEDPDSLRGPQFDLAWCDELGKWKHAGDTWDMLQFALRLGDRPRQVVTTTPRPTRLMKALVAASDTAVVRLRTEDNLSNLAPGFWAAMRERYGGTRLGRQELDGELIADRPDALWNRAMLDAARTDGGGPLSRIVVGVDPPAAETAEGSCCGIVVAGISPDGRGVVLADRSLKNASPADWGRAVARAFHQFEADRVVAEINQGGDMVAAILRSIDAGLPLTTVRASRGKYPRAEPVAALYEQGRISHAGTFAALEDEMCDLGFSDLSICISYLLGFRFCNVLQFLFV